MRRREGLGNREKTTREVGGKRKARVDGGGGGDRKK